MRLAGDSATVKWAVASALVLALGCGGPAEPTPEPTPAGDTLSSCNSTSLRSARRDFLDRVAAPPLPAGLATLEEGEVRDGEGWDAQALSWPHPTVQGDFVHAVVHRPDEAPSGPAPLLINVHGHWDAGLEADEVARRAQLFASRGWVVLSVASRGDELGGEGPHPSRAVHLREGIWGEMRVRRTGTTPLAWDLRAAQAGLGAALAGRLGVPIDPDAVAVMGFSGGAERAVVLASADLRIGAVVLGAHEYAFGTQHGTAGCTCGALQGAGEAAYHPGRWPRHEDRPTEVGSAGPRRAWRWLATAACRPGNPAQDRPVLVWDNRPDDVVDSLLAARPGVEVRPVPEVHGVTSEMAAASWAWLETTLRGAALPASAAAEAQAQVDATYPGPGTPKATPRAWPAPGSIVHGTGPAGQRTPTPLDAARAALRASRREQVRAAFVDLRSGGLRPSAGGAQWIRFAPPSPTGKLDDEGEVIFEAPGVEPPATGDVFDVVSRLVADAPTDRRASRWGAERGIPALAYLVSELLDARQGADGDPGWIGVGPGSVAVSWAALMTGGATPVVLVDAPVTLWARGPTADAIPADVPFLPWPTWTLAPGPWGMALDPWPAARTLGRRVRWVRPRSGTGELWTGPLPAGERFDSVEAATR